MTWFLTDEHKQLRQRVRDFAENEIKPRVAAMESTAAVEYEAVDLIARLGWIGVTIGAEYGGMGAGHVAKAIIIQELARISAAMGAAAQASMLGVAKILHFGTDEQKKTWLPAIAAGSTLPTIAVTEPGSGGHVLGMEATARRKNKGKDKGWVLNGRKVFIGNAHVGHLHGVVVRTARRRKRPDDDDSRALSAFLVESDRPGLTLADHEPLTGLRGFSCGELTFTDCWIPDNNLIGDLGDGLDVAYSSSILYGRPNLAAVALGVHQAVIEDTVRFAQTRVRYGSPLFKLPTVKRGIGLMKHRLMTAQGTLYNAVHTLDLNRDLAKDQRHPCDAELMNAKYTNADSAIDSARDALRIQAADGLKTGNPLERFLRDSFCIEPPAGTGDIQLRRLAETALGTYRGQMSQRFAA
ncbi:acyl-CoA dehydrogenase family protein [Streptomyces sp. NPDC056244]|uniref:acyl-CoA dehydrogenase family protein n=1 Tax=Streptomyces sp. NPDC056244 TaxID=3345762 RepID=UPI0035DF2FF0